MKRSSSSTLIACVAVGVALVSCGRDADAPPIETSWVSGDDYAVYSALLDYESDAAYCVTASVGGFGHTDDPERVAYFAERMATEFPDLDMAAFDDMVVQNGTIETLQDRFTARAPVRLVSLKEQAGFYIEGTVHPQLGPAFYEACPNAAGITALGPVGYAEGMDTAMVCITFGFDGYCAHMVQDTAGQWSVLEIGFVWIT